MKEITLNTKIADLLNEYEDMKTILISINPKFKKLNNPILRRTVAKIANIKQAAVVGGMEPVELLNKIRAKVGQKPLNIKIADENKQENNSLPEGIKSKEPKIIINANQLLDYGKNPLAETNRDVKRLQKGEILLIKSDFKPEPLIEEFIKKGLEVCSIKESNENFYTYIIKN